MKQLALTIQELAQLVGATIEGSPEGIISSANDLASASHEEVSFLSNDRYIALLENSNAGAILIHPKQARPQGKVYLLHDQPSVAFQKVLNYFYSDNVRRTYFDGIHPTAVIHETATVHSSVSIGPYSVIDGHTSIAEGTCIGAHVSIGPHCTIGSDVLIYPHSVIREGSVIGARSIIQPGAVIGSCGFGYVTDSQGTHKKLEQWGSVVLGEDVEIGANSTIDRARFKTTGIGNGTKIDNLVQIGHNVEIGCHCLIVSQVGVAGSTKIGNRVVLAGKVGISGHVDIGDNVMVSACSGVSKSLPSNGKYGGTPAIPLHQHYRITSLVRHIEDLFHRVQALEKGVKQESFTED